MLPVNIKGADDRLVEVSQNGELFVAPLSPNISQHWNMDTIDTAYNFAPPVKGQRMRLQNILMYGNKNVGAGDATVVIYTANSATSLTPVDVVMEFEIPKYGTRDLISLNLELKPGVYLNAKTNDNDVFLTMMGYYIADR